LLKYYIFGSLCLPVARCFQFNNVSLLACSTAIIRTVLTIKNVKFDSHFLASLRNLKLLPGFTRRCLSPVFSSSQMRGSCCFNEFTIFQLKCTWCVQKRVLFEFNFSHRRSKLQSDWLTLVQVGIMHVAWAMRWCRPWWTKFGKIITHGCWAWSDTNCWWKHMLAACLGWLRKPE